MNRISLAIALFGAVAAAGCGGSVSGTKGGNDQAGATDTFKLVVQNGQDGNAVLEIKGGKVFSADGKINCGVEADGTALTVCEAIYNKGSTVVLQALATRSVDVDPDPAVVELKPYLFLGWSGACIGEGDCSFKSTADQYVVATFELTRNAHSNYTDPVIHDAAIAAFARSETPAALNCGECHGAILQGQGIAVACASCHPAYQVEKFVNVLAAPQPKGNENCATCHATDGSYHQSIYDKYTDTTLAATIDSVTSTLEASGTTYKVVAQFTLTKNGQPYADTTLAGLGQKRYTATKYDPATKTFETASAFTFSGLKSLGGGKYTVEKSGALFAPELSSSFIYFYFAEKPTLIPPEGHYQLYSDLASAAKVYGTIDWTSSANVSACERCHGAPYQKHGYRAAKVAGLNDFVACKACHTDQRGGIDFNLPMAYDDPAELIRILALPPVGGEPDWTPEVEELYAYTATTMQDTHLSHAKEFLYPQSMGTCATCHEGQLSRIFADANFVGSVCKSCHPISSVVVEDAKRAPKLVIPNHTFDWSDGTIVEPDGPKLACNACHADDADVTAFGGTNTPGDGIGPMMFGNPDPVPLFKDLHSGYDAKIYKADGTKYSASAGLKIDSVTFNGTTNVMTVLFSAQGTDADALIKPTVVISLYGYDTKDFLVGGHASQPAPDGKRNLEWAEGASGNSPRLTVAPAVATAGNASWTATANLSLWAAKLADGSVKKAEIGVLPVVALDQNLAVQNNPALAGYNPAIAIAGATVTFDLVNAAVVPDAQVYGKAIVSAAKCNACHDALGTTFHSPSYGSAGVVGCRLCHVIGSGGGHLEMQSRSIDSYVHSIHSFQAFDIQNVDFADELAAFKYEHHTGATYPNFTTLNCESCHNPGTYEVPDVTKSLPGILSASSIIKGKTRAIGGVPSVVTGPGARACGGCHRAEMIKADDAAKLDWFDGHTGAWGYRKAATATETTTVILNKKIDDLF